MQTPAEPTPYRPGGRGPNRRRILLLVAGAVMVVVVGLALHVAGALPPE